MESSSSLAREQGGGAAAEDIKEEGEVTVKLEPVECAVCLARERSAHELASTLTAGTGTPLAAFLARFRAPPPAPAPRHLCAACLQLVNALDCAEREYLSIKETFLALLARNPVFHGAGDAGGAGPAAAPALPVKAEAGAAADDSEDEPLARTKRKHGKGVKKKKKISATVKKRKTSGTEKWECDECGVCGAGGGPLALATHKITEHTISQDIDIKTEDTINDPERSQSPFNNGIDHGSDFVFGDFEDDDDDADSTFNPEEFLEEPQKKTKSKSNFKRPKVWHSCDLCNARYSSLVRLEQHKLKHDGSKPPYICEVCGAHYKHKRACDIHIALHKVRLEQHKLKHDGSKPPYICEVCGAHYKHKRACDIHIALHKGISDWKCEECNKLFPSKNALQRHNNIHTGKLNYQCDLCGKSFIHTSSFKMHKLSHSGVKPHACDVCGLALMTRSHLKRHKRIHSGEKRHECALCGKRFSERYNLAAHAKSHEAAPAAGAPPPDSAPRRRLFRCHFCTERFERRYMLERHMSGLHGRTLERPPPTPRNTMSKLLKAQAQARHPPAHAEADSKDAAASALAPSKLLAQLTSQSPSLLPGAWGAPYAELSYSQP